MHKIQTEIRLTGQPDVVAFGNVTIDGCIRFRIQMRKYEDKETGAEKTFLSYPRRKTKEKWENTVHPDKELREEIAKAVGEAVKQEITRDFHLPDLEVLNVTPVKTVGWAGAKAVICGLATIKICGLTVKGITVKKGENGLFRNMPQYVSDAGEYRDIVYGTSKAMQEKITAAVLEAYEETAGTASGMGTGKEWAI